MRDYLYLASLLYQVGAFYQRATDAPTPVGTKPSAGQASPWPYALDPAPLTARFIDEHASLFDQLPLPGDAPDLGESPRPTDLLKSLLPVLGQSNAGHTTSQIIAMGHALALGIDPDTTQANDVSTALPQALRPITWIVGQRNKQLKEAIKQGSQAWHMPLEPLAVSKECLPRKGKTPTGGYAPLWKSFCEAFDRLQTTDCRTLAESLLDLLQKYAVNQPDNQPDRLCAVSLYDQIRTAAALSVCLYEAQQSGEAGEADSPLLLIGADLSGIQPYIYAIASKHAAKSLKGRSFYLRLLTDAVAAHLLKRLNLCEAQVVYNSGGGFYLLAPNTVSLRQQLDETVCEIEDHLFATHGTALYLAIESVPLPTTALTDAQGVALAAGWGALYEKRDQKKRRRFEQQLKEGYERFFTPTAMGLDGKCDVCTGEYFAPGESSCKEGELSPIRETTREQIRLGQALKDTDAIIVADGALPQLEKVRLHLNPVGLTRHYYFVGNKSLAALSDQLDEMGSRVTLLALNDDAFVNLLPHNRHRLTFYGGNEVWQDNFERLCNTIHPDATQQRTVEADLSRLGVLRMDVDNLGHLFQEGFRGRQVTLAHMSALSRALDYFFSGYLNTIWKETAPWHSLIVYSGGDDVFIVGDWRATIELAERIHNDFRAYCCGNPAFSISGGIALIEPRYPIIKGAAESDVEESRAKAHKCGTKEKNALSFLGMAMHFDDEYPQVKALKDEIVRLCNDKVGGALPHSFISKVLAHWENAGWSVDHRVGVAKTYWMLTYDLGRLKERHLNPDARALIDNCQTECCSNAQRLNGQSVTSMYHALELWALACRWAELEMRA